MPNGRAYSQFEIKSISEDAGVIEGIATTPTPDRMDDVVEPKGAQFKLPMPLLWQHDTKTPIGEVIKAKVTDAGIAITAKVKLGILPEIDRAWTLIKEGLVRGLSIGFRGVETADIKGTYGIRFLKWEWLELSAVTIPANVEASISNIKSYDQDASRASLGRNDKTTGIVTLKDNPGASGSQSTAKGTTAMTLKEQMQAFENKRAAIVAAMDALMKAANDAGETLSTEDATKFDEHSADIKTIDEHLDRLRSMEAFQAKSTLSTAKVVTEDTGKEDPPKAKAVPNGDGRLKANSNLPPGMGLARYVKALAFAKGNNAEAQAYAKQWEDSTPEVLMALKSAVAAGTTADSAWAGPLVYNANLASEFVEYLRPQLILGKMTGFRRVPFNVRFPTQSSGSTVGWVGEGLGKPVSKLQLSSGSLGFAKAAGIVVITQELARFSSPSAELLVRDDLAAQMIYFLDQQFIDPGVAAVANVNPASILNGASNVRQAAAAWTSMANVLTDVKAFLATFPANEISLDANSYWIMTPDTALALSLLLNTGGTAFAFPEITVSGGTFLGLPVIVSNSVPHSVSAGAIVGLVKASEVFLADDGQVAIDVSQEASLLMDSAPTTQTSATPTGSSVVSMFQTNSIAIRAERIINWARRRTYGVGYIDNMHTS